MANSRLRMWRVFLPMMVCLLVGGGLFTLPFAQPVAAATDGYSISNGEGPNHRPSMAISPDSSKVCNVWTTFNNSPNQTYVRIYSTATGAWSPDLSQSAFNVSRNGDGSAQGNTARCAIDGAGRTHVVWVEYPDGRVRYSMLAAGADPANGNNWTSPIDVTSAAGDGDGQNPDIVSIFADANGSVWLAYWSLNNNGVYARNWVNGSGWSGATKVSASGGKHPRIGADNQGYVHVIYQQSGAGMRYSYRDASNGQWNIDNAVPGGGGLIEQSGLAIDRDSGDVHIVFTVQLGGDDNTRVVRYIKKSGRTGLNFNSQQDITGQGNHVVARIAWSPSGKLTMVADKRDSRTVTIATSSNNGASWSGASDLTSGNASQAWPSVAMDAAGNSYITYWTGENINFVQVGNAPSAPACASSSTRFCDVPTNYWAYSQIDTFASKGRTTGCDTDAAGKVYYCPERSVTRAEMAVFIIRTLKDQAAPASQYFTDVPPTAFGYREIGRLTERGITTGCAPGEYCPTRPVNRAEMAAFIIRALTGVTAAPAATGQTFADVPTTHPQYGFIEEMYKRGVTTGCGRNAAGQLIYCPDNNVTRAEMAVFLERAYPNP